jgi:uncharacterized repeat protein (TIGR01451 family)
MFVSATSGGTEAGGVVTWNTGTLGAGASGSVQMVVQGDSPLPNGTLITNDTYGIDSNETAPFNGTSVTTTVGSSPVLSISKTASPNPVSAGGTLTYTLTYTNTGNDDATGVFITDTVPTNTTFVSATSGGAESGGVVTWNIGILGAGASGSVQMVVQVDSPLPNGTFITNDTYGIDSNETAPINGTPQTTTVGSSPVLSISKTASPDPVTAGGTLTYTLDYTNTGNDDATGVFITDTVPTNTTFTSATGGGTQSGGVVTWNIGTLGAGASGSVQMVVQVNSPLPNGTLITNVTYGIDSNETAPVNGTSVSTTVGSSPVLSISKTASPDPVPAGGTLTYTLNYTNTGNENATGVFITDAVPANTMFVSATSGGTEAGGVVTWNIGTLGAGASGSVQMVVRVNSPLPDGTTITNATYGIDSNQTASVNGTPVNTTVTSSPVLSISKTASPNPVTAGSTLTYTLTYANTGNEGATGVLITDVVPANTTFVSATAGGTQSGGVVTWNISILGAGASGSVQMAVRVNSPLPNGTLITNATYGIDSNETVASTGAAVTTSVSAVVSPIISSAIEVTYNSIYVLQPGVHEIRVEGSNFQDGAVLDLGAGISAGSTSLTGTSSLTATITVASGTPLGPVTITVTNPDNGLGTLDRALTVVKTADMNRDCNVDGTDLNILARAWSTVSTDSNFAPEADLDGDDFVGPDDLAIFAIYFGRTLANCP